MKKRFVNLLFGAALCGLMMTVSSAKADDLVDPFQFGATGRATAMGMAQTAVSRDVNAVFWNPAGLAYLPYTQATAMHSELSDFDDTTDAFGIATPTGQNGGLGFRFIRSSVSDIQNTGVSGTTGRPTGPSGSFSADDTGYMLAYGHRFGSRFAAGVTVKHYSQDALVGGSDSAVGADLGLLVRLSEEFTLGANLQNIVEPEVVADDSVPFNAKLGIGYISQDGRWTLAADVDTEVANTGDAVLHAGLEHQIVPQLAARLGVNDDQFTAGLGIGSRNWRLDYAYNDSDAGDRQRFSIHFDFAGDRPGRPMPSLESKAGASEAAAKPAPKMEEKKAEPKAEEKKPEPKPAAAPTPPPPALEPAKAAEPMKEEPKVVAAPAKTYKAKVFSEGGQNISIYLEDQVELAEGQSVSVGKDGKTLAEASVTSVGMFSIKAKITNSMKNAIPETGLIGNEIGVK